MHNYTSVIDPQKIRVCLGFMLILALASPTTQTYSASTYAIDANVSLTAGWATFGQVVPQGAAVNGLQISSLTTQTDIKNRWPDGSIKFAIVTANAPSSGAYAITTGSASSGSFSPSVPTASVALNIAGTVYTATLPSGPSSDLWLDGPNIKEWRSVITPAAGATLHPFLRVIFDTRVYSDGKARVDVTVENVLNQTGATAVTYDVTITVNGQSVFTNTAVEHFYLERWRKVFEVGAAPSAVTPDLAPFISAKAIPSYMSTVNNQIDSPSGTDFDILQPGAVNRLMDSCGGRGELGPFPAWVAKYVVHKNAAEKQFILLNGDLAGSWPIHAREPESGSFSGIGGSSERFVSLDQHPNLWFDGRAQGSGYDYIKGTPLPLREYGSGVPGPGQSPLVPDNAHQPSLAYIPYLLTGDRYYAEEMAFWANYGMLRTLPHSGSNNLRIIDNPENRGLGWSLRNIVDAAAYYPDSSSAKSYFTQKVANNLNWLDQQADSWAVQYPLGFSYPFMRPEDSSLTPIAWVSDWEQSYVAWAIDRANKQGMTGGLKLRDRIAKWIILKLTSDAQGFPHQCGIQYTTAVGTYGTVGNQSTVTWFTNIQDAYTSTEQFYPCASDPHVYNYGYGYTGPDSRLSLIIGVEQGFAGAQTALNYVTTGLQTDLNTRSQFAILPSTTVSQPPPSPPRYFRMR